MADKKISELTLATPDDNDVIPFTDVGTSVTYKALKSALKGDTGDAATVDAGTTTTGVAGSSASVVNSGSTSAAVFDFTIPRGNTGATGATGPQGPAGTNGTDGTSFTWQGAWSAGTYVANDVVGHNGSSWMATTTTTEEPSISATDWDLVALKGTDGEGSGDVTGPAGATADNIAVYNSTTGKIIKDGGAKVADFVTKATYDANSILFATDDNTPIALTVGTNSVVGRVAGAITTLAVDSDLSSTSASDDTVPSAKATKAMGDLKLPLAGGTMTGDIQLGETLIKLDATLSEDAKWSGISTSGTLGATIAVGDLCYLNADDSRWELVDANLSDGYDKQLGISLTAGNDGDAGNMLVFGKVRSAVFPTFTVGSPLYISETAGDVTHTQPTTADVAIRIVGFALTAEDLFFNPSNDYIIHS